KLTNSTCSFPRTIDGANITFDMEPHICSNLHSSLQEKTITMALLMKVWIWSGLFEMMPCKVLQWKHGDNGKK
ncbi:hypothetical protein L208DRAFT_1018113, partial [Tricholoma matsutake]